MSQLFFRFRRCKNLDLLGLMLGVGAIPEKWLAELELRAEIEAVAGDLFKQFEDTDAWRHRYPG